MNYEMKVDGMAEISELLSQMEEKAPAIAAQALYDGAGVMSGEIKKGAAEIKTAPFHYARGGDTRLPSPEEKEIVMSVGAGIAKFDKNGSDVDTSVGYKNAGYATIKGKQRPIPAIVNAINSGTSFMRRQPFVRKASRVGGTKAMNTMKATIEEAFENLGKK
jgi:hypothetical protein